MKLLKPSFEILGQFPGDGGPDLLQVIYKQIERAGRTCYKSEDKIDNDSAKAFVDKIIKSGHGAMLEHGTVYLKVPYNYTDFSKRYRENKYSIVNYVIDKGFFITTNYRVLLENNWLDDLQYLCESTEHHEKRVSVRFICDRGVSHELVRHRVFSFAQESTRYCNYSKDKFNNEITFIIPIWMQEHHNFKNSLSYEASVEGVMQVGNGDSANYQFLSSLFNAEKQYFKLLELGWQPQQARAVLPNALKTEVVMTGFVSDWEHFFSLRCAESAHPQMRELAIPLYEEFKKQNYAL